MPLFNLYQQGQNFIISAWKLFNNSQVVLTCLQNFIKKISLWLHIIKGGAVNMKRKETSGEFEIKKKRPNTKEMPSWTLKKKRENFSRWNVTGGQFHVKSPGQTLTLKKMDFYSLFHLYILILAQKASFWGCFDLFSPIFG